MSSGARSESAAGGGSDDIGEPLLRTVEVAKSFGPTQALRSCSLELRRGEVHAIVGENGSGKSTLVKILAGVHSPQSGRVDLPGREGLSLPNPRVAIEAGIATVFQEVLVLEPRSVLENVWIGFDGLFRGRLADSDRRRRAAGVLGELLEEPPPLDRPVEELSLSDRQACCIARALLRDPRVLVLDEATSTLDIATRDRLFAVLRRRVAQGLGVLFISHRMEEIQEIGDRFTVMRSGETVATLARPSASPDELMRLMTGEESLTGGHARRSATGIDREVVLSARGIVLRDGGDPIDLEIHRGELVGLAGLEGHGQDAFLRVLGGARPPAGTVDHDGVVLSSPRDAARHGVAYLPRERRAESLFESKSVRENFGLPTLARDRRWGLLRPARTRSRLLDYASRLSIKLGETDDPITSLSGGNQQKVLMARWLATEPSIMLLNDPTRGVDLSAKRDLYALLRQLTDLGMAVVMLSTEVEEHIELMDRVLVFRDHQLAAQLTAERVTNTGLVGAFFGSRERSRA